MPPTTPLHRHASFRTLCEATQRAEIKVFAQKELNFKITHGSSWLPRQLTTKDVLCDDLNKITWVKGFEQYPADSVPLTLTIAYCPSHGNSIKKVSLLPQCQTVSSCGAQSGISPTQGPLTCGCSWLDFLTHRGWSPATLFQDPEGTTKVLSKHVL